MMHSHACAGRARFRPFVFILLVAMVNGCRPSGPADVGPRKIEVLFLGHDSRHHDSEAYAPILASALALEGINITYTSDPNDLNPTRLADFDALLVYANHDSITASQEKALLDFVASGKGFLPIHSASYCFRNSDAVVSLIGGQFKSHETGTFTTEIIDTTHPITAGFTPFETWDETYVHEKHNPDRTVLMERVEGDHREPWTWVRTHGAGRVFYTAYGHDARTWGNPGFQDLIKRGILWAVGDDLRTRWEQLSFEPLQYTPHDSIPNYEKRDPPLDYQLPLTPEASMAYIQVPPGFELTLFASEPEIQKPIAMAWDERGRLWVIETEDYPNTVNPDHEGSDRIKILEDTDGDGRADRFTIFAEGLNIPTSLTFADDGVIVSMAPHFLFLKDTDGDDRADVREVILTGWGTYDTHAGPSNLRYGFDNWYWGTVGYSDYAGVVAGDSVHLTMGAYRFQKDGSALEQVARFTNNTWGLGFSETFDLFGSTANNEHSVYIAIPQRYYDGVKGLRANGRQKIDGHYAFHPNTRNFRQVDVFGGFTAAAGHHLYTARSFPQRYWNRVALVNEPTGGLLHEAILEPDGAGFREKDGWNLMASVDEWVSPIHAEVGPDGAVWVLDWYNFIVQHNPTPQGFKNGAGNAYINDALRDKVHGRIYRIGYKKAPAYRPRSLSKSDPDGLVDALSDDNLFWRITAQRLLVERGDTDVAEDLYDLVRNKRLDTIGLNGAAVHALWTLHGLGILDGSDATALGVVREALAHPAAGVRKAAVQVLPQTDEALGWLLEGDLFNDSDAHTRLAVLLKISELPESEAAGAALYALEDAPGLRDDTWLPEALYIAATKHRTGYLNAYAADIGGAEFARLTSAYARGEADPAIDWSPVAFDDAGWETMTLPAKWDDLPAYAAFDGVMWYRRTLDLPAAQAGRAGTIHLGAIYDTDAVYINGTRVGGTVDGFDRARQYPVPAGILAAQNVIAVRVEDPRGRGGFWGVPEDMYLAVGGSRRALAGDWRYAVEEEYVGGKRQDLSRNVPLAQQLLKQYASDIAGTPTTSARTTSAEADSDVARVALSVLVGQLKFDQTTFSVKAGQRVELVFSNPDDMQHNLLILEPGALETIGALADAMVTQSDAADRQYIPESPAILASTPLVNPRTSYTLTFTAPNTPGQYPFVCTFPGHWRIMQGVMVVG